MLKNSKLICPNSVLILLAFLFFYYGYSIYACPLYDSSVKPSSDVVNVKEISSESLHKYSNQLQDESVLEAQLEKIDSLKKAGDKFELGLAYIDLATIYRLKVEFDKCKHTLFKSLKIMQDINSTTGIAHANSGIGMFYWRRSMFDSAIVFMDKAVRLYKDIGDTDDYAIELNSLGSSYYQIGIYDKALSNYIESNKLRQTLNDYKGVSKTYNNIGMIYRDLSYIDKAKDYFDLGLEWAKISGDSDAIGYSYNNIASLYEKEGRLDSALYYYFKSIRTYSDRGYSIVIMNHKNIGRIYLERKEFEKAKEYFKTALEYASLYKDLTSQAEIYKSLSRLYLRSGDYEKALTNAGLSLKISEQIGSKELIKDNYEILASIYENRGDKTKALEFYRKFHENYIAMFNQEVGKKISVLEQQQEMERRKYELSIRELELQSEEFSQKFTTAVAAGFLIIILVLYYFNRKIKNSNTELKRKNSQIEIQKKELDLHNQHLKRLSSTQNKLFSIIAHDLRNPFHSMLGYSELLIEDFNNLSRNEQLEYIKTIKNALSSTYNLLVNLLYWTQTNTGSLERRPEKFSINALIKTSLDLSESQAQRKNISIEFNDSIDAGIIADKGMIEIVLRNLITNAIKYTPRGGRIFIETVRENSTLRCSVADEGTGMDSKTVESIFDFENRDTQNGTDGEKGSGLGLILCKEFIELNNGTLTVESELGKGSSFRFTLPIYDE